jgi:hypothetical protein
MTKPWPIERRYQSQTDLFLPYGPFQLNCSEDRQNKNIQSYIEVFAYLSLHCVRIYDRGLHYFICLLKQLTPKSDPISHNSSLWGFFEKDRLDSHF